MLNSMSLSEKTSQLGHTMQQGVIALKRRVDIIHHAALGIELPDEPVLGIPLVEILGNCRVLIENHHGVKGYSCSEITVCADFGTFCVRGNKLEIASMTKHRLVINGTIESVSLINGR